VVFAHFICIPLLFIIFNYFRCCYSLFRLILLFLVFLEAIIQLFLLLFYSYFCSELLGHRHRYHGQIHSKIDSSAMIPLPFNDHLQHEFVLEVMTAVTVYSLSFFLCFDCFDLDSII